MALAMVCLTSCGEDPLNPGGIPPSVRLTDNGAGSLTADATVNSGETYTLNIVASPGDSRLNNLTISEDGSNIDIGRLSLGGNPALLIDGDKDGIDWNVDIDAPTDPGTYSITATVTDDANEVSSVSISITIADTPPTIAVSSGATGVDVAPGETVIVRINASAGSRQLNTITVWEDGVAITDLTRLEFNGVAFTANPNTLEGADKDEITEGEVLIRQIPSATGTSNYTIVVEDEGQNAAEVEYIVNYIDPGTPLTNTLEGILFNSAGPQGTGGINLITGESTNSNTPDTHLHDEGVDGSAVTGPNDENWIKRISGESNGSEVKLVDISVLPEGFSFASVSSKEEIQGAHDNGNVFTNTNDDGELVSWEVEVGDMYTVQNGDNIFLIEIREVNEKNGLLSNGNIDNTDNYVIDIKF